MKKNKIARILTILLLVALTFLLLVACDDQKNENKDPTYSTYSVTVLDSDGAAMSGVVVTIYKAGTRAGANITGKDGKVEFADIEDTNYTVELETTSQKVTYFYDRLAAVLNPSVKDLTLTLYTSLTEQNRNIYGAIPDDTLAYSASTGSYHVSVSEGITYFVVELTKKGIYSMSVSGDEGLTIGNFGNPYYVMTGDISADNETGRSFTMKAEGDLVQLVIGVTSSKTADAFISINYVSDLPDDPIYAEWTMIYPKNTPEVSVLPDNAKLVDLDITDENLTVVIGADGYYHLGAENGPIVYVRVSESSKYIDSFVKICDNTNFGWYKYDGETFVAKECFNELIMAYGNACDERLGVCPLTEELAYAVQSFGTYNKWWDFSSERHIFGLDSADIVEENAWLFACATLELDTEAGTSSTKALSLRANGAFTLYENATLYYTSAEISDVTVTISSADALVVTVGSTEYTAVDSVISFTLTGTGKAFTVSYVSSTLTDSFSYTSIVAE